MAVRVFAQWGGHSIDESSNTKIAANVDVTVLGDNLGDLGGRSYTLVVPLLVPGLDVILMATIEKDIRDAVRADVERHGITFSVGDTVLLR